MPRRKETNRHTDDWLMTYADMITLLLCFFALFLALTLGPAQWKTDNRTASLPTPTKPEAAAPLPPPPEEKGQETLPQKSPNEETLAKKESLISQAENQNEDAPTAPAPEPQPAQEAPPQEDRPIVAAPPADTLPELIAHLKARGNAQFEQKGDRLTTVEMDSATFFAPGSANLSDEGKNVLRGVAANLANDAYRDYQITVEGHTDDTPINTLQFPSNWELSTARAAAVVQFFLTQGLPAQRLRAAGYADTFPKRPNRDEAGKPLPENQAQNRRVVIKLEKIDRTGP